MSERRLRVALVAERGSLLESGDRASQRIYAHRVACLLGESGHVVDILARRDAPALSRTVSIAPGVRVLHMDAGPLRPLNDAALLRWMPAFARQAQRSLQGEPRYNVICALSFMSGWVGLALRPVLHAPLVVYLPGVAQGDGAVEGNGFGSTREFIERTLALRSDRLLTTGPQQRADLLQRYGVAAERIAAILAGPVDQPGRAGQVPPDPACGMESLARELERVFASLERVAGPERRRRPRQVAPPNPATDAQLPHR